MNANQLTLNEQPLISTFETIIGNIKQITVNARDLHTFLQVGKRFTSWIQERIGKYEFIENEDFIISPNSGRNSDLRFPDLENDKKAGRPTTEYHITLDMAKELSMVENNAKGREARRYFIAMEKKALGLAQQSQPTSATVLSPNLTKEQVKELSNRIHHISIHFDLQNSANQNIMNRLRVDLSLRQMDDIRQCHFNNAMQILDGLYNISQEYAKWQYEVRRMAVDWILRDGRPWTPEVVKKLRGELDLTINQHPDWNKLALLVGKA